jgi:glycerate 2-kinase
MNTKACLDIFHAALAAADPYSAIKRHVSVAGDTLVVNGTKYDLTEFEKIIVVGAGKGTAPMAQAMEDLLGDRIDAGIIIVKYGHTRPLGRIIQREAAHPLPDEAGMQATGELLNLVRTAGERALVICLFSGGASALLVAPAPGISLNDKKATTQLLLSAGADIRELNSVRKHLSAIKGGRLAEAAYPATIITLVLSDVIDDPLDVIASGPTVPDKSRFQDALSVVHTCALEKRIPGGVFSLLHRGVSGVIPDTPKEGAVCFQKARTYVVGGIRLSLDAALNTALTMGFDSQVLAADLRGEARQAAHLLAMRVLAIRSARQPGDGPSCLLAGGETTVTVRGKGLGGRNQELALAFALEIAGREGITMLSAGTDGTDGPTDAAGAVVDGRTIIRAKESGINPTAYLENNDSYRFFETFDARTGAQSHLVTGPTGTNVMDLQIILLDAAP